LMSVLHPTEHVPTIGVKRAEQAATPNMPGSALPRSEPASSDRNQGSDESLRPLLLLVEDNEVNRGVALLTLDQLGYRADVATNGREAVEAVARTRYAAVLMDCQMPVMDGFEATRAIRDREVGGAKRALQLVSGERQASAGGSDKPRKAMDDYIAKPFRLHEVSAVLQKWVPPNSPATPAT